MGATPLKPRKVVSELLDHLPAEDPEAMRSRRDLRRINFLMGNERWVCQTVKGLDPAVVGRGIYEIGAGEGALTGKLAAMFPVAPVTACDFAPRPAGLALRVLWQRGDLFEMNAPAGGGVAVANLFLHHFESDALRALGTWLAGFDALVISEPDRARLPHFLGKTMHPWINRVTRHDMHVSIDAGFAAGELPEMLGLSRDWHFRESSTWRGARRVVGSRT
jgi:hypothetical protein